jgi:hypothetical protein
VRRDQKQRLIHDEQRCERAGQHLHAQPFARHDLG